MARVKQFRCMLCHQNGPHRRRDICDDCGAWLAARSLAWCTACRRRKQASDMAAGKSRCKACKAAAQRRRRAPGVEAERSRAWRARNQDRVRAYKRQPDVMARNRERARRTYHANPAYERARRLARYYANHDVEMQRQRERRQANSELYHATNRRQAMRRKLRVLQSWRKAA